MASQKGKKKDVVVTESRRPSDNFEKKPPPNGLIEARVTSKQIAYLQDPRNTGHGAIGFRPHKINNMVPVVPTTNEIIPDKDGTVGVALFNQKKTTKAQVTKLLESLK